MSITTAGVQAFQLRQTTRVTGIDYYVGGLNDFLCSRGVRVEAVCALCRPWTWLVCMASPRSVNRNAVAVTEAMLTCQYVLYRCLHCNGA